MATNNKKENKNDLVEIDIKKTEIPVENENPSIIDTKIDEPIDANFESVDSDKEDYKDIDAVCEMINDAKKERDDEIERQRKSEEEDRKRRANSAMAAQKAKNEQAKKAEMDRKINESRYIRKKMKRKATTMLFCLCIMSAIFGYTVTGIVVHIVFDPKVWIFVGGMGIFGMINTLIHTYLYRYIREEIYRK